MHADRFGAVIVGTTYGVLTHARAMKISGIDVVGLVGRDPAKTRDRAEKLGIPHGLTDVDAALDLPGVSIVAVTTPPHTHSTITLAAIAAGKHVLCEKPFTSGPEEARRVLAAAEVAGICHVVGTEYRFSAAQVNLRRAVASGAIGEPHLALFLRHRGSLVDPDVDLPEWWESRADGGGWLGAAGSHIIDQIRFTLGEFTALSATLGTLSRRPRMTADDTYTLHFELESGCTGVLHGSCAVRGSHLGVTTISGSDGTLSLRPSQHGHGEEVWLDTGNGPRLVPDPGDLPRVAPDPAPSHLLPPYSRQTGWHTGGADVVPCARLYSRLLSRIRGEPIPNDPPEATFADGVATQNVLDAARRSAAGAGWVPVGR